MTKCSFLANSLSETAVFEWSKHGFLQVTQSLGIHGLPPAVGRAVADAYHTAMKEHLAAASQRDKASGGAGFSSHAAPLPTNPDARERMIRAKFEEGCG